MPSEDIWIKLIGEEAEGLTIGASYEPPASDNIKKNIKQNIKQACQRGETIIMGDFNDPNIN